MVCSTERKNEPEAPERGEPRPCSQRNPQKRSVTVKSSGSGRLKRGGRKIKEENGGQISYRDSNAVKITELSLRYKTGQKRWEEREEGAREASIELINKF